MEQNVLKTFHFEIQQKGQLVKKAGNDLLTTGSFALGLEIKDIKDSF